MNDSFGAQRPGGGNLRQVKVLQIKKPPPSWGGKMLKRYGSYVMKQRREDLEHGLQKEICTFLDFQSAKIPMLYFAVPNALKFLSTLKDTRRISAAYAKMRAEGFKDGVSDLVVVIKRNNRLKLGFFEQKRPATYKLSEKTGKRVINTPAGKPTESQLGFLDEARKLGAYGAVSYTLEEFKEHWQKFIES